MGENSIPIVIGVILFVMAIGWIFSLAQDQDRTLLDVMHEADASYTPGQAINNAPTGQTSTMGSIFGFVLDIPVIGQILGFVVWIIDTIISMIDNVIQLPEYFPDWMMPVFAVLFLGFILYVYTAIAPTK